MQKLVWQNSNGDVIDLTSGNYGITQWEGFSNTSLNIQSQQVPFQDGAVFLDALLNQRELSVTLKMQDNGDLEERYRMRRELIHILNPKLGEGYLIYTNDFISKRIKCVAQVPLFETHNSDTRGTPKASLSWTACEPYWEDLEETEVILPVNNEVTIENMGDVPSQVKITLQAGMIDPTITNLTQEERIKLKGYFDTMVNINTQLGQKSITAHKIGYDFIGGDSDKVVMTDGESIITGTKDTSYYPLFIQNDKISIVPNLRHIYCIFLDSNGYILCANNGIYKSTDLKNWTLISNETFYKIKKYNNKYYGVGARGKIGSSDDLINWTFESTGVTTFFYDIIYDGSYYIIVGSSGTIMRSSNFSDWTSVESGVGNKTLDNINALNNTLYVLSDTNIIVSTNHGSSWTINDNGLNKKLLASIVYDDEQIIAVGEGGVYKSTDLSIWSQIYTNDSLLLNGICYNNGLFVAVGDGAVIKSKYLYGWEVVYNIPRMTVNPIYIPEDKLYLGITTNTINITKDIKNWKVLRYASTVGFNIISAGNGILVVSGVNALKISNKECETWTDITLPFTYNSISNIIFDGSRFIISVRRSNVTTALLIITEDFNTFTSSQISISGFTNGDEKIRFANNKYFLQRATGSNLLYVSDDLINWTNTNCVLFVSDIFYIPFAQKYVVIGDEKGICVTQDFISWEKHLKTIRFRTLVFNNERIFLFANNYADGTYTSINAIVWEANKGLEYLFESGVFDGTNLYLTRYFMCKYKSVETENLISRLTMDSDMAFNLSIGENKIKLTNQNDVESAVLSYRQKYIGV